MIEQKNSNLRECFQWLAASTIVLSTVLGSYRFFVSGISIGDLLVLVSIVSGFIFSGFKVPRSASMLILFASIALLHILYFDIKVEVTPSSYFRLAKIILLLTFLCCTISFIEKKYITKIFSVFILINVLIIVVQHVIFIVTGNVVLFLIPGIPLVNDLVSIESIHRVMIANFRPGGLYMEPAHLSYFLFFSSLYLRIYAWKMHKRSVGFAIIGMLMTFSSFGFFGSLTMFILTFLGSKNGLGKIFSLFLVLGVGMLMLINLKILLDIPQLARLLEPDSVAIYGRLLAGESMVTNFSSVTLWVGQGYGNFQIEGNINAYYYLLFSFGYAGLGVVVLALILAGRKDFFFLIYKIFLISTMFFSGLILTHFMLICCLPFLDNGSYGSQTKTRLVSGNKSVTASV